MEQKPRRTRSFRTGWDAALTRRVEEFVWDAALMERIKAVEEFGRPSVTSRYRIVDPGKLGPALTVKLAEREEAGIGMHDQPELLSLRERILWWGAIGVGPFVMAGVTPSVGHSAALLMTLTWLALFPLVGALYLVRRIQRRSLCLTWADDGKLKKARMWKSDHEWGADQSDAYRLVFYTVKVVERILASNSWNSKVLDGHRIRLNLAEEIRQIDEHAYGLHKVIVQMGRRPTGSTPGALRAQRAYDDHVILLQPVWQKLLGRVKALEEYANHLAALDESLTHLASLDQLEGVEDEIADLLTAAVADEFATDRTKALNVEIVALRKLINETLGLLRFDVATLAALAPKTPA
jgi:hypothetical protein